MSRLATELWWLWRILLTKLRLRRKRQVIQVYYGRDIRLMKIELYGYDPKARRFYISNSQKRNIRTALFEFQKGNCHWCKNLMLLVPREGKYKRDPRVCSLDHFYDRWTPELRAAHRYCYVAACQECNNIRSRKNQAAQPIEVLHERAKRHKKFKKMNRESVKSSIDSDPSILI